MNNIDCPNITKAIKRDFSGLWHCFQRGNTLEIVTPYLYPNSSFVSIFVTKRADTIIVSDGGMLSKFIASATGEEAIQNEAIGLFSDSHKIKEHNQSGERFYFKDCKDPKLVSSIAFDLCNFITATANSSILSLEKGDSDTKTAFSTKADKILRTILARSGKKLDFNHPVPEIKDTRFSAVIAKGSQLWLAIYITGCNESYFTRSTSDAIVKTQMARASKYGINGNIVSIIPILNTDAAGYKPDKQESRFEILRKEKCAPVDLKDESEIKLRLLAA